MIKRPNTKAQRVRRHQRVRGKISGTAERPRLSVFRSENNIYAQIIDDVAGKTLCSASTVEKGTAQEIFANPAHPYTIGLMFENDLRFLGQFKG